MEQTSAVIEWVDPKILKPHPFSVGIYGDDGYEDLVESIRELGVLQPLYVSQKNLVISGHRRREAAIKAEKMVPIIRKIFPNELDEREAIIEFNRYRIKNGWQLSNEGIAKEKIEAERAKKRMAISHSEQGKEIFPYLTGQTRDKVAEAIGLGSGKQWDKLKAVRKAADKGDKKAEEWLKRPLAQLNIHRGYSEVTQKEQRAEQERKILSTPKPQGQYDVLVIDPPWPYEKRPGDVSHSYRNPFPPMPIEDIKNLRPPAAEDCLLWLWTTNAFMHDAFHVLEAWGFEPKTILTWAKDRAGLGDWLRGQTEHCILAIKGKPIIKRPPPTTLILGKRREHSRKPEEFYQLVDQFCIGSKYEMYRRIIRDGWEGHGNEQELFTD